MWRMGIYILNAVSVSINRCLGGKADYLKEPLFKSNRELTKEEKDRKIDELFANLQIMQANFEASHRTGENNNGN